MTASLSTNDPAESRSVRRAARMAPAERRAQLIKAALRVFANHGIGAASHTSIAAEAGVAVPTAFHYFGTKEEIIEASLTEVSRFLLSDLLAGNDDPSMSAPEAIESILRAFRDSIDTEPDYVKVWLEWSVSVRGAIWESYLRFYDGALTGIKKVLKRGIADRDIRSDLDLDDGARVVVGVAHMVAQMKFSGASNEQVERTVHSLVAGYLAR